MTVDNNTLSGTDQEENKPKKTKEEHLIDLIKAIKEIDLLSTPFREARSEIKKLYKENGWLDRDEITNALKAYRMAKNEDDIEEILKYFEIIKRKCSKN